MHPFLQSAKFGAYSVDNSATAWGVILGTSAIALSYNVVHSLMIQQTSAVTTTVVGEAKIIGLLLLSYLLLGTEPLHPLSESRRLILLDNTIL